MNEAQHKESFKLGYNRSLDDAEVEPEDERRILVEVPPLEAIEAEEPNAEDPTVSVTKATNLQTPLDNPVQSPSAMPHLDA
ncbi:hypothetical protein RHMOL_Rhmol11G0092600 [Rhododendron molle]|uniref:Uncharacterized protein n=1 Tax=Rhododendron molle TaxID=49168 RepID=A0ACC0LQG4_RHOML|nr:hypothetical protein RHMOL_Rhmol11G0092600 [Rhododendron molle]